MRDKPVIRHCRNCLYHKTTPCGDIVCDVRYKHVEFERIRAVICKFYNDGKEDDKHE